ncbi:ABC transporter substrate-binding protein [Pseudolabrys sp.]|uniref:ABC transporter substrate-binding protein n=1 Tax=Pseudolabrys sp. TaxID=1960880 RepID=UPI003D0CA80D
MKPFRPLLVLAALFLAGPTAAQTVKVGVTLSTTGPAASLGIPEANTIKLLSKSVGSASIEYLVLDDATDTTRAVSNMRKFVTGDQVDIIFGSTTTPVSLATIDVAAELKIPVITLTASAKLVTPMDERKKWIFKVAQNDTLMVKAVLDHMAKNGVKTVGFVGFNDAYGDGWVDEMTAPLQERGMRLVASERYARTDTSATSQALKIATANPDAVFVGASGTPAALPVKALRERGYKGKIYLAHGAANNDFLRIGGKDVEGAFMPAGPVLVAEQLPRSAPTRERALEYTKKYEAAHGAGSVTTFGAHAFDAAILLEAAIPTALKSARPGTPEFRVALRDALENLKEVIYSQGVATMTPTEHTGQDERARVMVTIENGKWKLLTDQQ